MEETVQNGSGVAPVAQKLATSFSGVVAGPDGGAVFVSAHDDFQQLLRTVPEQALAHGGSNLGIARGCKQLSEVDWLGFM